MQVSSLFESSEVDTNVASVFSKKTPTQKPVSKKVKKLAKPEKDEDEEQRGPRKPIERDPLKDARTLFIGNVPLTCHKSKVKSLCSKFGKVESLRFRGLPVNDKWKGRNIRVGIALKDFKVDSKLGTQNCYVVFEKPESVMAAVRSDLNGSESCGAGHIIRLDTCVKREDGGEARQFDRKRTVYVHLIPADVGDTEIKEAIEAVDGALKGKIKGIRICHIKTTGRAFAYVMFHDRVCVRQCLVAADKLQIRGKMIKAEKVEMPDELKKRKEEKMNATKAEEARKAKSKAKLQKRFAPKKEIRKHRK